MSRPLRIALVLVSLAALGGVAWSAPALLGSGAGHWLHDDPAWLAAWSQGADRSLATLGPPPRSGATAGEWWLAAHGFAAVGHLEVALADPRQRPEQVAAAEAALRPLLRCDAWRFDTRAWHGECALDALGTAHDHAVLGYLDLPLSLLHLVDPDTDLAGWNDRISAHLAAGLAASHSGLLATYPGQAWPVDTSMSVAALALHARATGEPVPAAVTAWSRRIRARFVDPKTGLLVQDAAPDGTRRGPVRGSGTTLAAWSTSFFDPALSADLWHAVRRTLYAEHAGFGAVREVPPGAPPQADVDSGPVLAGYGVAATGFALGAARARGDEKAFTALYATAELAGGPVADAHGRRFTTAGPLGDALVFALCATRPPSASRP